MGSLGVDLIIGDAIEDLDASPPLRPQLAFHPQDFASQSEEDYANSAILVPPLEYKAEKANSVSYPLEVGLN